MKPIAVVTWLSRNIGYRGLACGLIGFALGVGAAEASLPQPLDGELLASGLTAFATMVLAAIAVAQTRDAAARERREAEQRHLQRRSVRSSAVQWLLDLKQPIAAKVAWCKRGDPQSGTTWTDDVDFQEARFAALYPQLAFLGVHEQNAVAEVRSTIRSIQGHPVRTAVMVGEVLTAYRAALSAVEAAQLALEEGERDERD